MLLFWSVAASARKCRKNQDFRRIASRPGNRKKRTEGNESPGIGTQSPGISPEAFAARSLRGRGMSAPRDTPAELGPSNRRDWQYHADRINKAWGKRVEGVIETGRALIEAQDELEGQSFRSLVESSELPFSRGTAIKLIKIAEHPILSSGSHVNHLPESWGTLYELTRLRHNVLLAKLKDGSLNPRTERKDVTAWRNAERGEQGKVTVDGKTVEAKLSPAEKLKAGRPLQNVLVRLRARTRNSLRRVSRKTAWPDADGGRLHGRADQRSQRARYVGSPARADHDQAKHGVRRPVRLPGLAPSSDCRRTSARRRGSLGSRSTATRERSRTNMTNEQWRAACKEAGQKIDPETAEVLWEHGSGLDPYGLHDLAGERDDYVQRNYFARSPGSETWVWFGDLPAAVRDALWEKHKSRLVAFPSEPLLIEVNTAKKPQYLIVAKESVRPNAVYVLIGLYDHRPGEAALMGWEWGHALLAAPIKDFGYGVLSHCIPCNELRAMPELNALRSLVSGQSHGRA